MIFRQIALFVCIAWLLPTRLLAQREYTASALETILNTHRTVAILPFSYLFDKTALPTGMNVDFLIKMERDEGYRAQRDLYERMLKKQLRYYVDVQDIQVTNSMLAKAGIDYYDLETINRSELYNALGVDAVICGRVDNVFKMTYGYGYMAPSSMPGTSTSVTIDLCDTHGAGVIWKLKSTQYRTAASYTSGLDKKFVDKILLKLPYKRLK